MTQDIGQIWVYLSASPLLGLTITLLAYQGAFWIYQRTGHNPLANPVLIAVGILAVVLKLTGTPYATYFEGAQFVHFLLGPATVALALPLFDNLHHLRRVLLPVLAALVVGSVVATGSALMIASWMGVDDMLLISLAPKSATAPVAIGISQELGGSPTLTAVLVILTGITGAVLATPLLNLLGVKDWRARGFSVGLVSHGIGTARALQVHPTAGAFAGLGMAINAVATAILAPLILRLFI